MSNTTQMLLLDKRTGNSRRGCVLFFCLCRLYEGEDTFRACHQRIMRNRPFPLNRGKSNDGFAPITLFKKRGYRKMLSARQGDFLQFNGRLY